MATNPTWIEPRTLEQAVKEVTTTRIGTILIKAGGVDVQDRLKEGLDRPERLLNLRRLVDKQRGLGDIVEVPADKLPDGVARLLPADNSGNAPAPRACLRLGTLVTLAQIESHPALAAKVPALVAAAHGAATPQVRAAATLGGNLLQRPRCWYFRSAEYNCAKKGGSECFAQHGENDYHAIFENQPCAAVHPSATATALVALDAIVTFLSPEGDRFARLSSFLVGPRQPGGDVKKENRLDDNEVLMQIYVPVPRPDERNHYIKIKQKQSFDWPLAEVAVNVRRGTTGRPVQAAKIILGSVAPTPHRAKGAEAELLKLGKIDEAALKVVGEAALFGAMPLARNSYKVPLVAGLVQRALHEVLSAQ
jgi:xanthine dehydrogenase YagS FAD-binding subunit